MRMLYRPVGLLVSVLGGVLTGAVFKKLFSNQAVRLRHVDPLARHRSFDGASPAAARSPGPGVAGLADRLADRLAAHVPHC